MTGNGLPTTSVAIPVYNGERFLDEAIGSVQSQTLAPNEFLVFDNASEDASRSIATEHLGVSGVRTTGVNQGAAWNFTRAVEESTGEFFAWLAADDRFAADFLRKTAQALESHPSASACLTSVRFIDVHGKVTGLQRDPKLQDTDVSKRLRSYLRRYRWTESYCLFRREALLASPMFRQEYGADVILMWWFLLRGPLVVLDEPLLEYRVYPVKTDEEMSESLVPGSPHQNWRKMRMWRALWAETAAPGLEPKVRRAARRELVTALASRPWIEHNIFDLRAALRSGRRRPTKGQVRP